MSKSGKKKEEIQEPTFGSWQSLVLMGLVATAGSSMLLYKGWRFNRNLNVFQKFFSTNVDSMTQFMERVPDAQTTLRNQTFRKNMKSIMDTAQEITHEKIEYAKATGQTMKMDQIPGDGHVDAFLNLQNERRARKLFSATNTKQTQDNIDNNDNTDNTDKQENK